MSEDDEDTTVQCYEIAAFIYAQSEFFKLASREAANNMKLDTAQRLGAAARAAEALARSLDELDKLGVRFEVDRVNQQMSITTERVQNDHFN